MRRTLHDRILYEVRKHKASLVEVDDHGANLLGNPNSIGEPGIETEEVEYVESVLRDKVCFKSKVLTIPYVYRYYGLDSKNPLPVNSAKTIFEHLLDDENL